jgi:hypothetical protein
MPMSLDPTMRGIGAGEATSVSTIAVPLRLKEGRPQPQVGDLAVVQFRGVDIVASPAGWTREEGPPVFYRRLTAGEPGTTVTFRCANLHEEVEWTLFVIQP